mgnify:CR=1 FL=1
MLVEQRKGTIDDSYAGSYSYSNNYETNGTDYGTDNSESSDYYSDDNTGSSNSGSNENQPTIVSEEEYATFYNSKRDKKEKGKLL